MIAEQNPLQHERREFQTTVITSLKFCLVRYFGVESYIMANDGDIRYLTPFIF